MLVSDIIDRARLTLADPNKERWPDSLLIQLTSEAYKTIAKHSTLVRKSVDIPVISDSGYFEVPKDFHTALRVVYKDKSLTITTFNNIENLPLLPVEPEYVVFNSLSYTQFKVIPEPKSVVEGYFNYDNSEYIGLYYSAIPETLTNITDKILINDIYINLFIHYILGTALRMDMDAQNRAAGNEELSIFTSGLRGLAIDTSKDFNTSGYYTKYTGGI